MTSPSYSLDLQGHRGARGARPENTLPAFAYALSLGVSTLELDCAITQDGTIVVSHDAVLNPDITRGPDGAWLKRAGPAISRMSFAALQQYDVGRIKPESAYARRFPRQEARDGTRIPKLADVFALARKAGNEHVRFNVETKVSPLAPADTLAPETFARALAALIVAEQLTARVTVQSFDWRTLEVVQRIEPRIATVYLTTQQGASDNIRSGAGSSPWSPGLHVGQFGNSIPRLVQAAGGAVWSPAFSEITADQVREAQALGLKVVVWTVNEAADIERMLDWHVDGIISDYPQMMREAAGRRGVPLPAATPVTP
jgi:glycerophosphoryl diester phosphodiesterase